MRSTACLIGVALAAMPLLSATALSAYPERVAEARSNQVVRVVDTCRAGQEWVEAGYDRKGEWRDAHCVNRDSRQE
jgi:hypothetical protein